MSRKTTARTPRTLRDIRRAFPPASRPTRSLRELERELAKPIPPQTVAELVDDAYPQWAGPLVVTVAIPAEDQGTARSAEAERAAVTAALDRVPAPRRENARANVLVARVYTSPPTPSPPASGHTGAGAPPSAPAPNIIAEAASSSAPAADDAGILARPASSMPDPFPAPAAPAREQQAVAGSTARSANGAAPSPSVSAVPPATCDRCGAGPKEPHAISCLADDAKARERAASAYAMGMPVLTVIPQVSARGAEQLRAMHAALDADAEARRAGHTVVSRRAAQLIVEARERAELERQRERDEPPDVLLTTARRK